MQVEIQSKIVGSKHNDDSPSYVLLELLNEKITVRELIAQAVEEQIRDMLINRHLDAEQATKILNRQYLLESEVSNQAKSGVIRLPGLKNTQPPSLKLDHEIQKALQSFKRKGFMIIVDEQQLEDLDECVTLKATSKVTFLRLTPLIGG